MLSKLRQDLHLEISRKFGKHVWDIKLIIDTSRLEIEAREKNVPVGVSNSHSGGSFSNAALFVGREVWSLDVYFAIKPVICRTNVELFQSIKQVRYCNAK